MIRGLRPSRNRLSFPAGIRPGIDWTHPAFTGASVVDGLRLSAVAILPGSATTANFINVANGHSGTATGTGLSPKIDPVLGPSVLTSSAAQNVLDFPSQSTADGTQHTMAVIFRVTAGGAKNVLCGDDAVGSTDLGIYFPSGSGGDLAISYSGSGSTLTLFTAAQNPAGTPFFLALSTSTTGGTRAVLTNLNTGQVLTFSSATNWAAGGGFDNNIGIGSWGAFVSTDASIAAFAWTRGLMLLPQLVAWANDPWSFWYPDRTFAVSQVFMSRGQTSVAAAPNFGWYKRTQDDRLFPPSRLPDQGAPFFMPSPNPVPTIWLPSTGEEDRSPAQKRPPDEPGAFFRSPSSFRAIWLPTTGEEDRLPAQKRPPDEPGTFFFQAQTSPRTTPSNWPVSYQEDRPPAQKRPPDEPGTFFFQVQVSPRTTPSNWSISYQEDRPPAQKRPPDEPGTYFRPLSDFLPTWLPTTGQEDRPPPFRPDLTPPVLVLQPPPPTVGIAGIAWWRQTEVYLEPPSSYRDYKPAWDPQFVVQIVPTFHEIYSNEFLSPVGATGHIKRNP